MSTNFSVTVYADVVIRVPNVPAETPQEAANLAYELATTREITRLLNHTKPTPEVEWISSGDNISGFLVDFPDDVDYEHTVFLNQAGRVEIGSAVDFKVCGSGYPELLVILNNLDIMRRELYGDWLLPKIDAAISDIRDIASVLKLRTHENHKD